MKLKRFIFILISILLTSDGGKTSPFLVTNPYLNTMISNSILNEHQRCRNTQERCVQKAFDLLDEKGFTSFFKKKKKCIKTYMVCLNGAQHNCQALCIKQCARISNSKRNGNASECATTCAQKCQ